jgi:hypothetical protein
MFVKIFEKMTNYYFENYLPLESKSYDSKMWVADISKLNNFYKIHFSLEKGIQDMINKI